MKGQTATKANLQFTSTSKSGKVGPVLHILDEKSGWDMPTLNFTLPPELEAGEPPEARGLARDEVRMLVSYRTDDRIEHARFRDIGKYLKAGDLLVVNTSATMNAALPAMRADGTSLELHLSTHLPDGQWSVELRLPRDESTVPFLNAQADETLCLPQGAFVHLLQPYSTDRLSPRGVRLWRAEIVLPASLDEYLSQYGCPIRYGYVRRQWPLDYYQTVFANETGSAEMPSAGRAFTPQLVTQLVARGVQFAPLLLHTGVASLESHEPPYPEYYRVPTETARAVNQARAAGKQVIAVGTTVVRALETVTDAACQTSAGEGWTELVVTPKKGVRAVDGLLTGLHEPHATHLAMLEAFAGRDRLHRAYREVLRERYLWHEFGDMHLISRNP